MDLLLLDQRHNYVQKLEEAKTRLPFELRLPIFRDLTAFVTPYALRQVYQQYKRLTAEPTVIVACTGTFTRTTGLICAHGIQNRMYDRASGGTLKLEDIHPHWRYVKPLRATQEEEDHIMEEEEVIDIPVTPSPVVVTASTATAASEDILRVQEPAIVRAKGRPRGSSNRVRSWASQPRQRAFEESTQREPSGFELVEELPSRGATQATQPQQVPRGRGGRGRGRGRSEARGGARSRARSGARGGQIASVPDSMMTSFQM